ncbi:MAG: hypothetical protein ACYSUC_12535, partial [Planctomycetota bacterium]
MPGLRDFMASGAGQVAIPALAGLASAASPRGYQGAQGALGGMQMAAQAEQSRAIGEEMAKSFDGPPNASDAESASRTTMPNDDLNRARRFIQASLR